MRLVLVSSRTPGEASGGDTACPWVKRSRVGGWVSEMAVCPSISPLNPIQSVHSYTLLTKRTKGVENGMPQRRLKELTFPISLSPNGGTSHSASTLFKKKKNKERITSRKEGLCYWTLSLISICVSLYENLSFWVYLKVKGESPDWLRQSYLNEREREPIILHGEKGIW